MSDPIALRIVDPFPPHDERQAGMMWRYVAGDTDGRECWWIVLPHTDARLGTPGHPSTLSWRTTDRASTPPHEMWQVAGTPPNITVTPSIDVECWVMRDGEPVRDGSYWHGFITNGVMQ